KREHELRDLLHRDHTLNGGILFGIEGHVVELQARAMDVDRNPTSWPAATRISGMARGAISEAPRRPIEPAEIHFSRGRATTPSPHRVPRVAPLIRGPAATTAPTNTAPSRSTLSKDQRKHSSPILDRIAPQVELERLTLEERFAE